MSSYYRLKAREALSGKWGIAVLAALIAGLLGGLVSGGLSTNIEVDEEILAELPQIVRNYLIIAASIGSILGFVQFILGGVVHLGYCSFLLKMHDGQDVEIKDLFSMFHRFADGLCLHLLRSLYIFLWTLLFIIPGIVASLKYAMAGFIMVEDPTLNANQAITASKQMMDGHKGELFILDLSFIGWGLLNILTLGIGSLWLNPYMNASYAAFYRNISSRVTVE